MQQFQQFLTALREQSRQAVIQGIQLALGEGISPARTGARTGRMARGRTAAATPTPPTGGGRLAGMFENGHGPTTKKKRRRRRKAATTAV